MKNVLISLRGGGLLLLLVPFLSHSQTAFFTTHNSAQVQLSAADSMRFQLLSDTSYGISTRIVTVADLRTAQVDDTLRFVLPGTTDTVLAEAIQVTQNDRLGFLWGGKLINHEGYMGYNRKDNLTAGFIMHDGDFFELMPIDTHYQFFVKRNTGSDLDTCGVPSAIVPENITPSPDCDYEPDYNTCPALISVLVIVDEFGQEEIDGIWGGTEFFTNIGEAMVNIAFYNSDIPNKEIRVTVIEKTDFPFSNPQSGLGDLNNLKSWSENERNAYKADLVVLLTGENLPGAGGVAFGGDPATDKAFAIVEANDFILQGAFAHELGHLFGCQHNWSSNLGDNDDEICAHARRNFIIIPPKEEWQDPKMNSWRTIVGVPIPLAPGDLFVYNGVIYEWYESWILHYSNPEVYYYMSPTGVTGGNPTDNAQQIRNIGCSVADYFANQELAVFVTSTSVCDLPITFTANILEPESGLPGEGPYTINWYWNTTGVFNGQNNNYLGTGTSIEIEEQLDCPTYWVKCVVQSHDNIFVSRIFKVQLPLWCECEPGPGGGGDEGKISTFNNTIHDSVNGLRIFPNPASDGHVFLQSEHTFEPGKYQIVDVNGRLLSSGLLHLKNDIPIEISLPGNAAGPVICRLFLGNQEPLSYKLMIQN